MNVQIQQRKCTHNNEEQSDFYVLFIYKYIVEQKLASTLVASEPPLIAQFDGINKSRSRNKLALTKGLHVCIQFKL